MMNQLRAKCKEAKLDAYFISNKDSIQYFSQFTGSNGYVLVTKNHCYLLTDQRYIDQAIKQVPDYCDVVDIADGLFFVIHKYLAKHRVSTIGFESKEMTYAFYQKLDQLNGFKLIACDELIAQIRSIKTEDELRQLRKSQKLNEQVLKLAIEQVKRGMTEVDLAWKIQLIAHDLGADGLAFDTIVAFGANSAIPHHHPSAKKKLKSGDLILIDMGVNVQGYKSDMTRVFFTKAPTKEQLHVYETVLEAHTLAAKSLAPEILCDEVDMTARKHISHSGYSKKFTHATGHGIGLAVHEYPVIAKSAMCKLEEGMVITIEPGIYLSNKFGIRIEDMYLITKEKGKSLTGFSKELTSLRIKL